MNGLKKDGEKGYIVYLPFTGKAEVHVSSSSEEEAIAKAMNVDIGISVCGVYDYQWDLHRKVVDGSVCYAVLNEVVVEENPIKDEEGGALYDEEY